jgi:hypothetical protein
MSLGCAPMERLSYPASYISSLIRFYFLPEISLKRQRLCFFEPDEASERNTFQCVQLDKCLVFYADVLKLHNNSIFLAMKFYNNHEHVYSAHLYKNG